jgi:crotonobetainyl-CoA:carnitine CoA-transferase CaiB-like acyl-CoA transferase
VLSVFPDASQLRAAPFDTQEGRTANRHDFVAVLSELCADLTQQELYEGLQAAGVPVGAVYTAADLLDSPQYRERDFLIPIPGSGARQPAIPVRFNGQRPRARRVDA